MNDIRHILTRKPIPPGQLALFHALYFADHALTRQELADAMRWGDSKSLGGVLGALGNRIGQTDKVVVEDDALYHLFIDVQETDGTQYFRMQPELRKAIDALPKLHDILHSMTIKEIYERWREHGSESDWPDIS